VRGADGKPTWTGEYEKVDWEQTNNDSEARQVFRINKLRERFAEEKLSGPSKKKRFILSVKSEEGVVDRNETLKALEAEYARL
jgi:hypothetical protein